MRAARLGIVVVAVAVLLSGCAEFQNSEVPLCPGPNRNTAALILMAQAVPSAAYVPCISDFPVGWSFGGQRIRNGQSKFWMDSDRAGIRALEVLLTASCDVRRAVQVSPEPGKPPMRRFEEPKTLPPTYTGTRYYLFPGGCVTYRFTFLPRATYAQVVEASQALSFVSRADGVVELAKAGVTLCGRGVTCPG